jgi:hypothetical protein
MMIIMTHTHRVSTDPQLTSILLCLLFILKPLLPFPLLVLLMLNGHV